MFMNLVLMKKKACTAQLRLFNTKTLLHRLRLCGEDGIVCFNKFPSLRKPIESKRPIHIFCKTTQTRQLTPQMCYDFKMNLISNQTKQFNNAQKWLNKLLNCNF